MELASGGLSHRQFFLQHLAQTSPSPLAIEIVMAEGVWMFEPDGHKIIDLISGIGVSTVGHRHPEVIKAIQDQLDKYLHLMVYGELVQTPQLLLAEALNQTNLGSIDCYYFTNSGSEAVEGAIKLAKRATGRPNFIACHHAYHGSTAGALSADGGQYFKDGYYPVIPGFRRGIFGSQQLLDLIDDTVAAVLIETVQGEAGVRTACKTWWQALQAKCNATGTLLILDEIQTGVGRTGKFWAFEHYNLRPDIILSAKGIGGGMPIGFFGASRTLMSVLSNEPVLGHITTFGGHPLSCVAATATVKLVSKEVWMAEVERKANYIKERVSALRQVKEIRGLGLLMAIELHDASLVQAVIQRALSFQPFGVLTDWFLFCYTAIRIAPPISITITELAMACDVLEACFSDK
jgi:acetylornithine/succinyldiaminopimelate/putrescine aminotransferase